MTDRLAFFTTNQIPAKYNNHLRRITLAYETYGILNAARDNAILIIHGFSASSHAASHNSQDVAGWWEWAVGPGKPLDTDKYFVVCSNNFGSCFGSTGPVNPPPAIADIVFCQRKLQEALGIVQWQAVIGGSLGGMAVLEWVTAYPENMRRAVCLNAGAKLSFIGQGLMDIQQELIRALPDKGLNLARRLADLSYVGEEFFIAHKQENPNWRLNNFLTEESAMFVDQFNGDSYMSFLQAMCSYDLTLGDSPLCRCMSKPEVLLIGCREDILFPVWIIEETKSRLSAFTAINQEIVHSQYGHDAFLLDEILYSKILRKIFS